MSSELHRNQVTDAQTTRENLRDAAYHEAGHVVVAQFLGLTVREVEIEEDGSGRADIRHAAHFSRSDSVMCCRY
jgi:ATP-dependent Zn protease